jgi:hypothetical protein
MKMWIHARWMAAVVATVATGIARGEEEALVTAVFAKTHNGYARAVDEEGRPRRETYVVGQGEYRAGLRRDPSIEQVKFAGVVRALAPFLAGQNYVPAPDKQSADLMLVLHWGTTLPWDDGTHRQFMNQVSDAFKDAQSVGFLPGQSGWASVGDRQIMGQVTAAAQNELYQAMMMLDLAQGMRRRMNESNANLLGYVGEINRRNDITRYAGLGTAFDDLIQELEEPRYYVVIGAYDFQEVLKGRQKLLWSTRVSIREQGNRFDAFLPAMFAQASEYFGEDSRRLVRRFQRAPKVELGELKTLGVVGEEAEEVN